MCSNAIYIIVIKVCGNWLNLLCLHFDLNSLLHDWVSIQDLRIRDCWFDSRLSQYSVQGLMIVITTGFIPLTDVNCFDNGYVVKQPVACKEYCAKFWLK